jgi:hypothetical protein
MIIPTHKRCGSRIQDEEGVVTEYVSINAAKRASRSIGLGKIVTVPKLGNITRTVQIGFPHREVA